MAGAQFWLFGLRRFSDFLSECQGSTGFGMVEHSLGCDDELLRVLASVDVVVAHAGLPVVRSQRWGASHGEPGAPRGEFGPGVRGV